jgi:phosphate/sulfate permease
LEVQLPSSLPPFSVGALAAVTGIHLMACTNLRAEIPVSTTQCITGAIVGVSLCNGTVKALNWSMVAWIYSGWLFSLPLAGIISYSLTGFVVSAPGWRGL